MSKVKYFIIMLALALGIGANVNAITPTTSPSVINTQNQTKKVAITDQLVNPISMIQNPQYYLNKNVKIKAKFDKFSTLGLDYKPAMRSSDEYISFLIQRPDVIDHNIPLSELKIFIKRSEAEKHIDLDSGDEIEFSGKVFSIALGDVWMDVNQFTVITEKAKVEKK